MALKVMAVDDETSIRNLVRAVCEDSGYECVLCEGGEAALETFQREWPDVVVLDVMMPRIDGFEVCRRIREMDENVPVLFLSARDDIIDKRIGFSFGGDDYMVKPFNEEELILRIDALVRRSRRVQRTGDEAEPATPAERFTLGKFTFDALRHEVLCGDEAVSLTPKEFQLLYHLASHPGAVMGKDELIETLWGEEYVDGAISIAVYVRKIREKIEDNPAKPVFLKTVWGVGYSFEA
ncbi:response regulator transcription factor [Adlercreutzia shanghongiae]|uniref:Response regulator transcription factor n=1 Tax=Adlercreutzia shanghongiae TaxID=3111773 RepID=A0ABU6J2A6_9ACTN|nr:response regulator transcription factor [Adlercreutzia sp. R22]MEC4295942.1 response regulator transcription factor [Adlercreutzia sp. R22]